MQYNTMNPSHPTVNALLCAILALPVIALFYFMLEPAVVAGQGTTREFTITQNISGEVSFVGEVDDVTMVGNVEGLSGGTALGSTTFQVNNNSATGYTVTIEFENPAAAMQQVNGTGTITNLGSDIREVFTDGVAANQARFGLTVEGDRVAQSFGWNGSSCDNDGSPGNGINCWVLPDTSSALVIVDGEGVAFAEEHVLHFQVHVNENPSPALEAGNYTATATLTVAVK